MSSMDNREQAFENKYAHDQQKLFRIEARASKLIGLWTANQLGLTGAEADIYAKEVVASNLDEPGFDDVKRKIVTDLKKANLEISDVQFEKLTQDKMKEAEQQIEAEAK
jgi:hypothetical protein